MWSEKGQSQDHVVIFIRCFTAAKMKKFLSSHENHHRQIDSSRCTFDIKSQVHSTNRHFSPSANSCELWILLAVCKLLKIPSSKQKSWWENCLPSNCGARSFHQLRLLPSLTCEENWLRSWSMIRTESAVYEIAINSIFLLLLTSDLTLFKFRSNWWQTRWTKKCFF